MKVTEAILARRTKRKFLQTPVNPADLEDIVNYARFIPSGANMQPLKYAIISDEKLVKKIFPFTKWSGYVPDGAPSENEQPPAYICMLGDTDIKESFETDAGAAGAVISLVAEEMGLSTCWLGAIDRDKISLALEIPENLKVLYLIAVGHSVQEGKYVDMKDNVKYYIDENNVLCVPKRGIDEILIKIF